MYILSLDLYLILHVSIFFSYPVTYNMNIFESALYCGSDAACSLEINH